MRRCLLFSCLFLFLVVILGNAVFGDQRTNNLTKVWKTIELGTHKSVDELRAAIKARGSKIWYQRATIFFTDDECKQNVPYTDLLDEYVVLRPHNKKINLVVVSVSDLGFSKGASLKQIYDRARALRLDFCPWEVAMQLRLQYKNQPKREMLVVAVSPRADSQEVWDLPLIVNGYEDDYVHYERDLVVFVGVGWENGYWSKDRLFVFMTNE